MSTASELRKSNTPDPARVAACKHDGLYWYSSPHDERGWFCADCFWSPGEEPGYSPEHDRDHLRTKVSCILQDLADAGIVSISNSDHGEGVTDSATRLCRRAKTLDSESIAAALTRICAGDGKFWRERHESILAGKDNRPRCACGNISHIWCNGVNYCSKCSQESLNWGDDKGANHV